MADLVQAYVDAKKVHAAAVSKRSDMAKLIVDAGNNLRAFNVQVSNIDGDGYPELPSTKCFFINADLWPTARQIHDALVVEHRAIAEMNRALQAIPEETRKLFVNQSWPS